MMSFASPVCRGWWISLRLLSFCITCGISRHDHRQRQHRHSNNQCAMWASSINTLGQSWVSLFSMYFPGTHFRVGQAGSPWKKIIKQNKLQPWLGHEHMPQGWQLVIVLARLALFVNCYMSSFPLMFIYTKSIMLTRVAVVN